MSSATWVGCQGCVDFFSTTSLEEKQSLLKCHLEAEVETQGVVTSPLSFSFSTGG